MGRFPRFLAEKRVKVELFCEKITLSDKLLAEDKCRDHSFFASGHRSTMVMTILLTEGYTSVTSLKGGFGGWVEAGFPVVEYAAP
ncbi:MAG: rhodanese-like domain-containing protein [Anaerolineales bacterium]|jgi:hypothetical protein